MRKATQFFAELWPLSPHERLLRNPLRAFAQFLDKPICSLHRIDRDRYPNLRKVALRKC